MDQLTAARAKRVTEFWRNVRIGRPDDCWPWMGYEEDGYGRFYFAGRMYGAHELAVTFTTGEIRLADLDTCHSRACITTLCCNPAHLRFDTRQGNVADAVALGHQSRFPSRLTDEQVECIRARVRSGAAQKDLAEQYGVSPSMISMIKTGKRH